MNATDDLRSIEETTDWAALIEMALAVPPQPALLAQRLRRWATVFQVVHHGAPEEADYPEPIRVFFRRLAFADFSPELLSWIDNRLSSKQNATLH